MQVKSTSVITYTEQRKTIDYNDFLKFIMLHDNFFETKN